MISDALAVAPRGLSKMLLADLRLEAVSCGLPEPEQLASAKLIGLIRDKWK